MWKRYWQWKRHHHNEEFEPTPQWTLPGTAASSAAEGSEAFPPRPPPPWRWPSRLPTPPPPVHAARFLDAAPLDQSEWQAQGSGPASSGQSAEFSAAAQAMDVLSQIEVADAGDTTGGHHWETADDDAAHIARPSDDVDEELKKKMIIVVNTADMTRRVGILSPPMPAVGESFAANSASRDLSARSSRVRTSRRTMRDRSASDDDVETEKEEASPRRPEKKKRIHKSKKRYRDDRKRRTSKRQCSSSRSSDLD